MHAPSSSESMAFVVGKQRFSNRPNNYKLSSSSNYTGSQFSGNKSVTGNKRAGSYYYCTPCEVPRHSLERCFRIHVYPPDYKPLQSRFTSTVQGDDIPADENHAPASST